MLALSILWAKPKLAPLLEFQGNPQVNTHIEYEENFLIREETSYRNCQTSATASTLRRQTHENHDTRVQHCCQKKAKHKVHSICMGLPVACYRWRISENG